MSPTCCLAPINIAPRDEHSYKKEAGLRPPLEIQKKRLDSTILCQYQTRRIYVE